MRLSLACVAVCAGCAVADDPGPQTVRVIAPLDLSGRYGLADERLETLQSTRQIRGEAARLRGGGSLILEEAILSGIITADTEQQVRRLKLVSGDRSVSAQYEWDGDVVVPMDWESLIMFSFYRHLERGRSFFFDLGVEPQVLPSMQAQFNVRITAMLIAWGQPLVTDNAGYTPLADSFLLFPESLLGEGIPLAANAGVVVHELSHALKHHIYNGDNRVPLYIQQDWPERAISHYRADDEGLADFFAAVSTGDSDFIGPSLPQSELDRDVAVHRPFSQDLYDETHSDSLFFNPYPLGGALASWLWETAGTSTADRIEVARSVLRALETQARVIDGSYRITDLINHIATELPGSLQSRACGQLQVRLEGDFRRVPVCDIF